MESDVPRLRAVRVSRSSRRFGGGLSLLPDHRAPHAWVLETQDRRQPMLGEAQSRPILQVAKRTDEVLLAVTEAWPAHLMEIIL